MSNIKAVLQQQYFDWWLTYKKPTVPCPRCGLDHRWFKTRICHPSMTPPEPKNTWVDYAGGWKLHGDHDLEKILRTFR